MTIRQFLQKVLDCNVPLDAEVFGVDGTYGSFICEEVAYYPDMIKDDQGNRLKHKYGAIEVL